MNHDTEVLGDEQVVTGVRALNKIRMKYLILKQQVSSLQLVINPIQIFLKTFTLDETGYIVNVPELPKLMLAVFCWR
jgi:bifunctional pyridoxal-dependent enzyme with beta-cystathionase and maltose regulon repressor activities